MEKKSKGCFRKMLCFALAVIMCLSIMPGTVTEAASSYVYLDSLKPASMKQYTGNMGDSFIYAIGKHKDTKGTVDVNGKSYKHGLEAWIARWNYTAEKSWAYSTYNLNQKYKNLTGKTVVLKSYNTSNFNTTLYFYGDGKLLKKIKMTPSSAKHSFNVNVAGVKKLKVYVKDNTAVSGGTSFGLTDCKLYKAAPPKQPTVNDISIKSGTITGITSKNVTVYIKIGTTTYSGKSNAQGKYTIKTEKIKDKTTLKIWAANKYKMKSSTNTVFVKVVKK